MPTRPLHTAVIGCGILARAQHIPNIVASPDTQLHTCCDLDKEILAGLAREYSGVRTTDDFQSAVADPDVDLIVVATTEHFRVPIVEAAARAGKPVLMEKPMAANWADALRMRDLVRDSGIPFCVAHNRRCAPALVEARAIFRQHMHRATPLPWRFEREGWETVRDEVVRGEETLGAVMIRVNDDWRSWKPVHLQGMNARVGLLLSEMTHFADLACWFLDSEPERVSVLDSGVLNHAVAIRFASGEIASITMMANGSFGYPKELLEATGRGGIVVCDHMLEIRTAGVADAPVRKTYPMLGDRHPEVGTGGGLYGWLEKRQAACEDAVKAGDPMRQFTAEPDKGHARMLGAFIEEIRGERPAPVSPVEDALRATRLCMAAVKSALEHRVVEVAEI